MLNRHWENPDALRDIVLHYAFLFNYRQAFIFDVNPPFWTLAVEVQFYLLLPLFFLLVRNIRGSATIAGKESRTVTSPRGTALPTRSLVDRPAQMRLARIGARSPDLGWVRNYSQMLGASLIAYAIGSMFLGVSYWDILYHLVVIAVLLSEIARKAGVEATLLLRSLRRLGAGESGHSAAHPYL